VYLGLLNTFEETEHDECERTEGSLQGHLPLHELQVRRRLPLQQLSRAAPAQQAGRNQRVPACSCFSGEGDCSVRHHESSGPGIDRPQNLRSFVATSVRIGDAGGVWEVGPG
jgi:hypothetical protein